MAQFYTDFSEYSPGTPSDWTKFGQAHTLTVEDYFGERSLKISSTQSSSAWSLATWNKVPASSTGEILVKFRISSSNTGGNYALLLGHSGSSVVYLGGLQSDYTTWYFRDNGSSRFTLVAGTSPSSEWLWARLRFEAGTVRGKVWNEGEIEPEEWGGSYSSSSLNLAPTQFGIGGINRRACWVSWYSVGTNGDSAPSTTITEDVDIEPTTADVTIVGEDAEVDAEIVLPESVDVVATTADIVASGGGAEVIITPPSFPILHYPTETVTPGWSRGVTSGTSVLDYHEHINSPNDTNRWLRASIRRSTSGSLIPPADVRSVKVKLGKVLNTGGPVTLRWDGEFDPWYGPTYMRLLFFLSTDVDDIATFGCGRTSTYDGWVDNTKTFTLTEEQAEKIGGRDLFLTIQARNIDPIYNNEQAVNVNWVRLGVNSPPANSGYPAPTVNASTANVAVGASDPNLTISSIALRYSLSDDLSIPTGLLKYPNSDSGYYTYLDGNPDTYLYVNPGTNVTAAFRVVPMDTPVQDALQPVRVIYNVARYNNYSFTQNSYVYLYQGNMLIKTMRVNYPTDGTLTQAERDSITDWSNLELRVKFTLSLNSSAFLHLRDLYLLAPPGDGSSQTAHPPTTNVNVAGVGPTVNVELSPRVDVVSSNIQVSATYPDIAGEVIDRDIEPEVTNVAVEAHGPEVLSGRVVQPTRGTITVGGHSPEVEAQAFIEYEVDEAAAVTVEAYEATPTVGPFIFAATANVIIESLPPQELVTTRSVSVTAVTANVTVVPTDTVVSVQNPSTFDSESAAQESLVQWWRFDDLSGTVARNSKTTRNATYTGTVFHGQGGVPNSSNPGVRLAPGAIRLGAGADHWDFFFKVTGTGNVITGRSPNYIYTHWDGSRHTAQSYWRVYIDGSGNLRLFRESGITTVNGLIRPQTTTLNTQIQGNTGRWIHLAYSGNRVYINGRAFTFALPSLQYTTISGLANSANIITTGSLDGTYDDMSYYDAPFDQAWVTHRAGDLSGVVDPNFTHNADTSNVEVLGLTANPVLSAEITPSTATVGVRSLQPSLDFDGHKIFGVDAARVVVSGVNASLSTDQNPTVRTSVAGVSVRSWNAVVGLVELQYKIISNNYTGMTARDAPQLEEFNLGPVLHTQARGTAFRLGNISNVKANFKVNATGLNEEIIDMVSFSVGGPYEKEIYIPNVGANQITDLIRMRVDVPSDATIGEGTFILNVEVNYA